jgi:DNA-binding IscR family transcriptional regulator
MIDSRRGQSGGFEILDRGRQSSMREVIEAIDGPIYINLCLISGASCDRKSYCPAHPFWTKAQEAMLSVLNGAIIADLAAQASAPSPGAAAAFQPAHLKTAGKANPASRRKS